MKNIALWFNKLPNFWKLFISSLAAAIPFYFSAFLSFFIAETQQLTQTQSIVLYALMFIVLLTLITFMSKIFKFYLDGLKSAIEQEKATIIQAYTACDRIITSNIKLLNVEVDSDIDLQKAFIGSLSRIQQIVEAVYQTFASTYGKATANNERTDFEVTFMTKSYIDNKITIPASANKDARSPTSMIHRVQNPDIYDNTITAFIYRGAQSTYKIIEDTTDPKANYEELYEFQKNRIKSSIVFPVLSDKNELLGTLVVHCDKKKFFTYRKQKYWSDLIEIFAKRIAVVKIKLDKLNELSSDGVGKINISQVKVF